MMSGCEGVAPAGAAWGSAGAFSLWVPGVPRPQGSKNYYQGRGIESSRYVKAWRSDVRSAAIEAWEGPPLDEPVAMLCLFVFPRPKSHHVAGERTRPLKATAPTWMASQPDTSKVLRAVEDAIKGVVYTDDRLVVASAQEKTYGRIAGVRIVVRSASGLTPTLKPT